MPLGLALSVGALACDRPPSVELREWTPADHDRTEELGKQMAGFQSGPRPEGGADNSQMLAEVFWQQSCAVCHGQDGRGDGPNGPLVKAPDLTREEWQARTTDEQIAARITQGKGLMPKFDVPPTVLPGLVARIRSRRGR